eukprot:TRINITY_DN10496_c0_g1_i1.p1 TRINITY_DN10496_c0_g1~~TRINITY_DN10496_c0_g1_i1.p1  ORF type:complete len:413 (+),score=14.42 TRINITY_DN10496_c0_g1_i1:97-1335(+)
MEDDWPGSTDGPPSRHEDAVTACSAHPGAPLVASSDSSGGINVWSWGEEKLSLVKRVRMMDDGTRDQATCLSFSHSGSLLCASLAAKIVFYDTRTWMRTIKARLPSADALGFYSVSWSPDDSMICASSGNSRVVLWDAAILQPKLSFPFHDCVWTSLFGQNGNVVLGAGSEGVISIWDIRVRKLVHRITDRFEILSMSLSKSELRLAYGGASDTVSVVDFRSFSVEQTLAGHQSAVGRGVRSLQFSPDDALLAAACEDGIVRLWDAQAWQPLGQRRMHLHMANACCFSLVDSMLISAGEDNLLSAWRLPCRDTLMPPDMIMVDSANISASSSPPPADVTSPPAVPVSPGARPLPPVSVCANCGVSKLERPLKRCGACQAARYCSVECQTAHWNVHRFVCRPLVAPAIAIHHI